MVRNRAAYVLRGGLGLLLIGVAVLAGCGEQDLYKPPHSPYQVLGRLPLESAPEGVGVLGNRVFVAGGQAGVYVIDVANPSVPTLKQTIHTKKFAEAVDVASVTTAGAILDVVFVVEGTEGITTYNVTDPDSAYSFEQGTTAVDGNGLYIELPDDPAAPYTVWLAENWHGIRIFDSDLFTPGVLRYNGVFAGTRGYAKDMAISRGYLYIADDEMGLAVLDARVRQLGFINLVSSCDTAGNARGIAISGGYAFLADGLNGLVVMAIDGAETPVPVGHLPLAGFCRAVEVRDQKAFLAAQDGGVHVVGVSDPANPVLLGTIVTQYATGLALGSSGIVAVSDRFEGLIVLGGAGAFQDGTAPARTNDLAASTLDSTSVRLSWHAAGNDLYQGIAAQYDIRYATEEITDESWDDAVPCEGEPQPGDAGTAEDFDVEGLEPGGTYYFALKTGDAAQNWSGMSNVAIGSTAIGNVPPVLTGGAVNPDAGGTDVTYAFTILYRDADGDAAARSDVVVDGTPHPMTAEDGTPETGVTYRYEATFDRGSHEFYFAFDDGKGHPIETEPRGGPYVGVVFRMGSPSGEVGRDADETVHSVVLTRDVEISLREVTQDEYEGVMGANPSVHVGANRPVENVTWLDAVAYCNALSESEGKTPAYTVAAGQVAWDRDADGWRLPTEAEWEWACRAGTQTSLSNGDLVWEACNDLSQQPDAVLDEVGWYCGNAEGSHHDVGTKEANAGGLFDLHGNVAEWCWDWYVADLGAQTVADPAGPSTGDRRVIRGGSWYYFARDCRSAARAPYWPNSKDDTIGFRVVRNLP